MDKIEVSQEDKLAFIEFYEAKIQEYEDKVSHYKGLIAKIKGEEYSRVVHTPVSEEQVIEYIKDGHEIILEDEDSFIKKSIPRQNWKFLSLSALKKLDELSTTPELYDHIVSVKSDLAQYDKGDVVSKISTALSNLYAKANIYRIKNNLGRGYFWALPSWYENGNLLDVYKYSLLEKYGVDEEAIFGNFDEEEDVVF